jgi:DNA polymerase I-like protein with 3'-5' exonuclease and polymerase domains
MSTLRRRKVSADDCLQAVLNRLDQHSADLAYDSETSGLDWRVNHVVGHVVTFSPDPRDSYYIPFRHAGGGNVGGHRGPDTKDGWDGKLAPGERELLDRVFRPGRRIVGHNLAFDLKFVFRLIGTQAFEPQFEDTMINEPLIDEFAGKFSLEACCARRGVQAKKGQLMYNHIHALFPEVPANKDAMGHFWRLAGDDPIAVEYATGDGTSTWQLRDSQMIDIRERVEFRRVNGEPQYTSLEKVHNIESRLIRILARMTCKGIKVDVAYFEALRDKLNGQIEELIGRDFAGHPDQANVSFQAGSDVRWFMEKHGVTDWPMTPKTKKPSFPESWLKLSEPGRKIIAGRQVVHMRNSFITPLLEEHIWKGRVHANMNQMRGDDYGTIIGRLSEDSPNLQQAHKRDPVRGRMLRGGFLPDDGMIFAEADYRQCEPVLLAYYSRCKVLLDGFRAVPPIDAHAAVTRAMNLHRGYDDWDAAQKKAARENGKRINQTLITGGGMNVIVEKYDADPKEVAKQYADYFRAMPEIKTTQKNMSATFRRRKYMVTLLGRRLHLPTNSKHSDMSYVALNRILAGGNADVLKSKMVEIDDYLEAEGRPPIDMLNNIHDAIDFQFAPEARPVYNKCIEIMQQFGPDDLIHLDLPLGVDHDEGPNWAIATFGEEK